ncbi:MAG TPA: isocitrate/isopropylmalate dehydrogenase family protein [Herpetosiphonaceae bacterium]|nr:isocitrate/isopropylmalate dehydrogenase family protein [Herpetosiphonaceae bacterium]
MKTICTIPGDGIGVEVIGAARRVLEALRLDARFVEADAGWTTFFRTGNALPEATLQAVCSADATLFGAVSSPSERVAGYRSPIVGMRRALSLSACVRPVQSPPLAGARPDIDIVVVRENTEGLYSGLETRTGDEEATAQRVITRAASERIVRWALSFAQANNRRRITVVHKANVLRETCGLFRETALRVLADAAPIAVDEMLVDNAAYQLARNPERFDVIVTTNLFGDILSDVASVWGGGLGLAASANYGPHTAIFEPVHGSAPDIAGTGRANPLATFSAAALMLDYLGEGERATLLRAAINAVLRDGPHTPDLGGAATTDAVTERCLDLISEYAGDTGRAAMIGA